MKNNKAINAVLQKPMNRKEFLQHSAAAVLFVVGGGAIVQSVAKHLAPAEKSANLSGSSAQAAAGYGSSVYGGGKTSS